MAIIEYARNMSDGPAEGEGAIRTPMARPMTERERLAAEANLPRSEFVEPKVPVVEKPKNPFRLKVANLLAGALAFLHPVAPAAGPAAADMASRVGTDVKAGVTQLASKGIDPNPGLTKAIEDHQKVMAQTKEMDRVSADAAKRGGDEYGKFAGTGRK